MEKIIYISNNSQNLLLLYIYIEINDPKLFNSIENDNL